jgi:fido (protein-threonine AMPylation protein)
MARRQGYPTYGKRFVGNTNHKEVHDLDNETVQCQIDEIIQAGHAVTFNPDTLQQAHSQGYDNGKYCLGRSTR